MRQFILIIYLLATCLFFSSCSNGQTSISDHIIASKASNSVRIKGTKIFIVPPQSYKPIESMARYQKDDNTYFQVISVLNSNFDEYKKRMTKEAIEAKGAKIDIYKQITYNGYDAIYCEGPSKNDGETKNILFFGDPSFTTILVGVYQTNDTKSKEDIIQMMNTSYYDKSFELNPLELANFKFNTDITGFKYAETISNTFYYTPNGKEDLKGDVKNLSCIQIMTLEARDFTEAKQFLDDLIAKYNLGGEVSDLKKNETNINGNQAYEMTYNIVDNEKKKKALYQVVIIKSTSSVVFVGVDNDNGKYIDKYKATAHTIQL